MNNLTSEQRNQLEAIISRTALLAGRIFQFEDMQGPARNTDVREVALALQVVCRVLLGIS